MGRLTPIFLMFATGLCPAGEATKNIVWQRQLDAALKLAQETGKPLLIDFWATWCGPCKAMDTEVWTDARVNSLADRYVFVSIDVDTDLVTKNHYLVHALPTIVVADPWGHTVQLHEGYASGAEIVDMLRQLPSDYGEVRQWYDILGRDQKNAMALCRIARFYADRHAFHLSNEFYSNALKTNTVKEDAALCEALTLAVAINELRDGNTGNARKKLDSFLKAFPDGRHRPEAMLTLVVVELKQRKRSDAEKTFQELQRSFPDSPATARAKTLLSQAQK